MRRTLPDEDKPKYNWSKVVNLVLRLVVEKGIDSLRRPNSVSIFITENAIPVLATHLAPRRLIVMALTSYVTAR